VELANSVSLHLKAECIVCVWLKQCDEKYVANREPTATRQVQEELPQCSVTSELKQTDVKAISMAVDKL
jgi:hypothetical protein